MDYRELRFTPQEVDVCYLCSEALAGENSTDHVIPNSIFLKESPKRPKLPTHYSCNNKKSKSDEWFIRQIQKMGALNPVAAEGLNKLLDKALAEKADAGVIGKSDKIRNYKLARTILEKDSWGTGLVVSPAGHSTLKQSPETIEKVGEYIKQLTRGLFILNVPDARPDLPSIDGIQYAGGIVSGQYAGFMASAKSLIDQSWGSCFEQNWTGVVKYKGSQVTDDPNKGFVYIDFYDQVGFLAVFGE